VEDHAPHRDLGLERLEQVPGDGLTLAVTVCREVELVDALEGLFQLGDRGLLVRRDDVDRLEPVVDVDAQVGPRLALVLGRHLGRLARQVPDVPAGGFHDEVPAEVRGDLARLRR
jgi:hypothetical protein